MSDLATKVILNWHDLKNPDITEAILQLNEKESLTIKEALAIKLQAYFNRYSRGYFDLLWRASRQYLSIGNLKPADLREEHLNTLVENCTDGYIKCYVKRLYRRLTAVTVRNSKSGDMTHKKAITRARFIEQLSFPQDYSCPKDVCFKTLMEYWMFTTQKDYSRKTVLYEWMWIYKKLEPLYGKPFNMLCAKDAEEITTMESNKTKNRIKTVFRKLRRFATDLNIISGVDKAADLLPTRRGDLNNRTAKEYVDKIYFPPDYKCPKNIRLKTLAEYWLFLNRGHYSDSFIYGACISDLKKLKPLFQVPYYKIRPENILDICADKTDSIRLGIIRFYRYLDLLACREEIVLRPYSRELHCKHSAQRLNINIMSDDECMRLLRYAGEKDVDVALTLAFFGLRIDELRLLNTSSINGNYLCVQSEMYPHRRRRFILKEYQIPIVQSFLQTIEKYNERGTQKSSQKYYLRTLIENATERILKKKYTPTDLRDSFVYCLLKNHVPVGVIEYLRGTRGCLQPLYTQRYIHYTQDEIDDYMKGVMNYV